MIDETAGVTQPSEAASAAPSVLRTSRLRTGGRRPKAAFDEVALLRRLEKEYDVGAWVAWRPTDSGVTNDSWFVETASGELVVRRSHDLKTEHSLRFELALTEYLRAHGYPAPAVVPTRTGELSVTLDDVHHMVTRRLPGAPYRWEEREHLGTAARGLGWFHRLVHDLPADQTVDESSSLAFISGTAREHLGSALAVIEPVVPVDRRAEVMQDVELLHDQMAAVHDALAERLADLTYLITHGSYGPTSVLLERGRLSGVMDYDRAAHDLLTLDLATAVWVFSSPSASRRRVLGLDPERMSDFLEHYADEHEPGPADLALLVPSLIARRLVTVSKKVENLLTKSTLAPRDTGDGEKFARMIAREAAQCRWLEQHAAALTQAVRRSTSRSTP